MKTPAAQRHPLPPVTPLRAIKSNPPRIGKKPHALTNAEPNLILVNLLPRFVFAEERRRTPSVIRVACAASSRVALILTSLGNL